MLIASLGPSEIGIVLVVILVLFGARRLPELGRNLAEGIHEFKKASKSIAEDQKPDEVDSDKK